MSRTRVLTAGVLLAVGPLLVACGGSGSSTSSGPASSSASSPLSPSESPTQSPTDTATASPADSPSESSSESPSASDDASSTAGEAGGNGDVTTFCETFTGLSSSIQSANPSNLEEAQNALRNVAQRLRDSAPAEISKEVGTYAGLIDGLANEMSNPDAYGKAVQDFFTNGNSKDVVTVAAYVAKNCD